MKKHIDIAKPAAPPPSSKAPEPVKAAFSPLIDDTPRERSRDILTESSPTPPLKPSVPLWAIYLGVLVIVIVLGLIVFFFQTANY